MQNHSISPRGKIRYIPVDRGHDTPCWEWQMSIDRTGYGRIRLDGRHMAAHRFLYEEKHGPVNPRLQLDHLCRNRACVNPDHLQVVTSAQNTRLGRSTPLTHEQVAEIRKLKGKMNQREAGRIYGVHYSTIGRIWSGKRWAGSDKDVVVNARKRAKYDIDRDMVRNESRQNPRRSRDSAHSRYRVQDSADTANTDE